MSSFFTIASAWIPLGTDPDWATAEQYIGKLQWGDGGSLLPDEADDGTIYHSLIDQDDGEDMDEKLRAAVRDEVKAFRQRIEEGSDEIGWITFDGWKVWITAGKSFGDSPTEVMDLIMSLEQMGVLEAAGFNHKGGRYDSVDFTPDSVRGRIDCSRRDLAEKLKDVPDEVLRAAAKDELARRDDIWQIALEIDASAATEAIAAYEAV